MWKSFIQFTALDYILNRLFLIFFMYIYIYIVVEFTNASPSDYCNNKESPPEYLIVFNKDGTFGTYHNQQNNHPPELLPSVNQRTVIM